MRPRASSASGPASAPAASEPSSGASSSLNGSHTLEGPVVCVFCGFSSGTSPKHLAAARSLAQTFHAHGIRLVYGGGAGGLMGELARTLVSLAGPSSVHGIIPSPLLTLERDHQINEAVYGRTTVVKDMHTRKQLMAKEVIDAGPGGGFVALSGGYGTLEELMEVVTWNQLGIHDRPVVVYNVDGYWDGLMSWVRNAVSSGFINAGNADILVEAQSAEKVVVELNEYRKAAGRLDLQWQHS